MVKIPSVEVDVSVKFIHLIIRFSSVFFIFILL